MRGTFKILSTLVDYSLVMAIFSGWSWSFRNWIVLLLWGIV